MTDPTSSADPAACADTVTISTDGSCLGNPGPGGWAAVLSARGKTRELSGGYRRTTNNRMELLAAIEALATLTRPCTVVLRTDSKYVKEAITHRWLANWQRNGWMTASKKPVKNKDLWLRLAELLKGHKVDFRWVMGHAGDPDNERCDVLAKTAASKSGLPADAGYEAGN